MLVYAFVQHSYKQLGFFRSADIANILAHFPSPKHIHHIVTSLHKLRQRKILVQQLLFHTVHIIVVTTIYLIQTPHYTRMLLLSLVSPGLHHFHHLRHFGSLLCLRWSGWHGSPSRMFRKEGLQATHVVLL